MKPLSTAVFAMVAVAACDRSVASPPEGSSASPASAPAQQATPTKTTQTGDGRCDPMPKVGTPCTDGDSYCVESWGVPGGSSSALWCRGGKWEREEERNLPADEGAQ